jgi:hypothetical protein
MRGLLANIPRCRRVPKNTPSVSKYSNLILDGTHPSITNLDSSKRLLYFRTEEVIKE